MLRRVLAACFVGALTFGLLLAADDPAKAPKKKDDATIREEATMHDHRKLGRDLELFDTDPLMGAGLPYWLPAGAAIP